MPLNEPLYLISNHPSKNEQLHSLVTQRLRPCQTSLNEQHFFKSVQNNNDTPLITGEIWSNWEFFLSAKRVFQLQIRVQTEADSTKNLGQLG
jgi:hypothetical protein